MKKLSILFVLAVMLAGVSVQAQKKNRIQPPPPPPMKQTQTVQDEDGGGYFTFDIVTGEFKCNMCEYGLAFGGVGQVKIDGFNIYITALSEEYSMFVSINVWDKQGKAVMEIFNPPPGSAVDANLREYWTDGNIYNNTLSCASITGR